MNNRVILILGGCVVLLLICCCAVFVIYFVFGNTLQQQIMNLLGTSKALPLSTVAPGLPTRGSASTGNPLADALGKSKTAKYRMEFSWVVGEMKSGKYQEQPMFDMTGETDGVNLHMTSKGDFMAMLGGSPTATIEIMEAGGKTYMKGVTIFGLTDPKVWYITDDSSTLEFKKLANVDKWTYFEGGNINNFKKVRSESVDNLSCDVWAYDFKTVQVDPGLSGMFSMGGTNTSLFSAIDRNEIDTWLCNDGFVHKYVVDFEGHDSEDANQKGALKMNDHMWDFNAAIQVTVPADAKPMPK